MADVAIATPFASHFSSLLDFGPLSSKFFYSILSSRLPGPSLLLKGFNSAQLGLISLNLRFSSSDPHVISFLRLITHSWHFHRFLVTCPFCELSVFDYSHLYSCSVVRSLYDNLPFPLPNFPTSRRQPWSKDLVHLIINPPCPISACITLALLHAVRTSLLSLLSPINPSAGMANRLLLHSFKTHLLRIRLPNHPSRSPLIHIPPSVGSSAIPLSVPAGWLVNQESLPFHEVSTFSPPPRRKFLYSSMVHPMCPLPSLGAGLSFLVPRARVGAQLSCSGANPMLRRHLVHLKA